MFRQELGKNPEEIFREIESEPVAAASLAQVLTVDAFCLFFFMLHYEILIEKSPCLYFSIG